jgi:hypothetical protein
MVSTSDGSQPKAEGQGAIDIDPGRASRPTVADQPRQNQNVVISMTAVRRAARALKRVHDEQTLMWEGLWRGSRFPVDHSTGGARRAG